MLLGEGVLAGGVILVLSVVGAEGIGSVRREGIARAAVRTEGIEVGQEGLVGQVVPHCVHRSGRTHHTQYISLQEYNEQYCLKHSYLILTTIEYNLTVWQLY